MESVRTGVSTATPALRVHACGSCSLLRPPVLCRPRDGRTPRPCALRRSLRSKPRDASGSMSTRSYARRRGRSRALGDARHTRLPLGRTGPHLVGRGSHIDLHVSMPKVTVRSRGHGRRLLRRGAFTRRSSDSARGCVRGQPHFHGRQLRGSRPLTAERRRSTPLRRPAFERHAWSRSDARSASRTISSISISRSSSGRPAGRG